MLKKISINLYRLVFHVCEFFGFHITPVHHYMPIPNTRTLKNNLWKKKSDLPGINMCEKDQINLLSILKKYELEYNFLPIEKTEKSDQFYINNNYFESVDSEILYSLIRFTKPKKIVEIGSGFSTLLNAKAIMKNKEKNDDYNCKLIAIDPYPNYILKRGFKGLSKLISTKVQEIPVSFFKSLESGDILFVDSSHVIKIGNDVNFIYNEILPRLKKGVLIHIHDIFLPLNYPKNLVKEDLMFWNEQYLVQAFLAFNSGFKILWASSYMHINYPDLLEKYFKSYQQNKRWPGSLWIKKVI